MKTFANRSMMIANLPGWLEGAEVGVQRGEFSEELLRLNVLRLYLVDPWRRLEDVNLADPANIDDGGHEENLRHVRQRFSQPMLMDTVRIVRHPSPEAARFFNRNSLDFVYLDGNHTRAAVMADLLAWEQIVRPNGCLCGHDFVDNEASRAMGFGVVQAVAEFCATRPWQLDAITEEEWPSFKLVRR